MISNCVINLSGDKNTVIREAARVEQFLHTDGESLIGVTEVARDRAGIEAAGRRDGESPRTCQAYALAGDYQLF